MARNTVSEVLKIVITDSVSDEDIPAFQEIAELLVDEELGDTGQSDERLKKIELFLTAHFIRLKDKEPKESVISESRDEFQGWTSSYWTMSHYGQHAIMLDTSQKLRRMQYPNLRMFFNERVSRPVDV